MRRLGTGSSCGLRLVGRPAAKLDGARAFALLYVKQAARAGLAILANTRRSENGVSKD